jgi:hypothetical protein
MCASYSKKNERLKAELSQRSRPMRLNVLYDLLCFSVCQSVDGEKKEERTKKEKRKNTKDI